MKRALVLNGGGSRGAYEIGVWQALSELGVRFDGVYGTSIGALNAALFAQGDLAGAIELWSNIRVSQIMAVEDEDDFAIERMIHRKRDVVPFLMENAKHLRMDISPLEALVREHLDEGRIRAAGMRLGVMTTKAPQMTGAPVKLADMKPGSLGDWVIASASCFPIFPARHIDGQRYIDGGYYDNLPVDMALSDGMDEVVAVELHPYYSHPEYARMPWLTTIKPLHDLGGFLDFNPDLLRRGRLLGYCDTMKRWGRLEGFRYTFRRVNDLPATAAARRYMRRLTAFDGELIRRGVTQMGQPVNAPLLSALERECEGKALSWKDVWLRGLELCAEAMGFRVDAVYDAGALARRCRAFCAAQEFVEKFDDAGLQAVAKRGERALLAFLYQRLNAAGDFPPEALKRLSESPMAVAGAMFLANQE
ncbi:MAG: patatin-like phospholipase family protein [Clostridia bacterium]|nr:patatin-like phospholipase family protein [Clostridia bacterium]